MASPNIQSLLKLQKFDILAAQLEQQMNRFPLEVSNIEKLIAEENAAIKVIKDNLKQLEVERNDLETSIQSDEEQINKYKNQQISVKKNEEYQALEQQIAALKEKISETEDKEIELMLTIDEQKKEAVEGEKKHLQEIERLKRRIEGLSEKHEECRNSIEEAVANREKSYEAVAENDLKTYKMVKTAVKRPPYIVELVDHKCLGCHIRVSNDVAETAKLADKIARCSSCGRIVYLQ